MNDMNGILVVNHFLTGKKFNELHTHLLKTAQHMKIGLDIKTNLELATERVLDADFALFWDKDINLAKRLEKQGIPVFNSASSIAKCDDKARTYIELLGTVPQPETIIAPKFYFKPDLSDMTKFVSKAVDTLGLPLVFKECFGSFGQQVYLCETKQEILSHISEKPFILQEFIRDSAGSDTRLEVVGGECVCAVRRKNKADFRSNVTNGGEMIPYTPSCEAQELAVKACNMLSLDFGGVDLLDNGMVCEVNSNAHIINIMNVTNMDIAPKIFQLIKEKIK